MFVTRVALLCEVIEDPALPSFHARCHYRFDCSFLCDVIEDSAPPSLQTVIMWLSWLYGGVDFSTTSSRNRHLGEVCCLFLLLVVRSLALELLLGSSWGHLGPSWGYFWAVWRPSCSFAGVIFMRRHRGFDMFGFKPKVAPGGPKVAPRGHKMAPAGLKMVTRGPNSNSNSKSIAVALGY